MSYYDRLQGQLGEVASSGGGKLNQLNQVKSKAQDAFAEASGDLSGFGAKQLDQFMKMGAKHVAEHTALKLVSKKVVAPMKAKLADQNTALDASKEQRIGKLSGESDEIATRAEGRLTQGTTEDAYKMADGSIVGDSARGMGVGGGSVRAGGEAVEGKVVPTGSQNTHPDDMMDKDSGLKDVESERLGEIADTGKAIAGEEVGGWAGTASKVLDFLGPVGEIAQLGVMLGEGIKNAVEGHKEQMKDMGTETSAISSGAQASMYAGMNRPSFGSMALPSFDTSKSSVMLQQ